MSKLEKDYQKGLIKRIKAYRPPMEITVLKNDAQLHQGIPDLTVIYQGKYAMLEVKRSESASHRPNQDYYIKKFGEYTFAKIIYPENETKVLSELADFFGW